jgi:nucleotide-binding universal stress UspA family protein
MTSATHLSHVVAATDESEAGRQAVRTALELAVDAKARVTVLRVVPLSATETEAERMQLRRWVESDMPALMPPPPIAFAVARGLPGIEIGRFAERSDADLLVLGRTPRSHTARLLLGDTADAVSRRSRLPCLFVPPARTHTRRLLVAVDGSDRGMTVLRAAGGLAQRVGAELQVLTVEVAHPDEPSAVGMSPPLARSLRAQSAVRDTFGQPLEVRRGDPAEQILAAVNEHRPDVLVLGCHPGGPAGVIEAGSTTRRLIHSAPCAVLTVPL